MREILFRGQRRDTKEWVYGDLRHGGYVHNDSETYIMRSDYALHNIPVDPETVGQYTGMAAYWSEFDNEPQEADVWEHDLLEVKYEEKTVIAVVKYEVGMFILCSTEFADGYIPLFNIVEADGDEHWIDAKKIGNIHDNPELLEVRENAE